MNVAHITARITQHLAQMEAFRTGAKFKEVSPEFAGVSFLYLASGNRLAAFAAFMLKAAFEQRNPAKIGHIVN